MKHTITFFTILLTVTAAQAQSPVSISKKVKTMPAAFEKPDARTNIYEDGKTTSLPWIVFSDRDENYTYTAPGGSLVMKKIKFMEPFYVSQESNGYLKLIKYQPGMVQGRKLTNKKAAQSYGWISKNKVLLWQAAYVNKASGHTQKAVTMVSDKGALLNPDAYYDRSDSLYVYNSPDLSQKKSKVALNQLLYIYKKSPDGKTVLVGSDTQLIPDSALNSVYGWIPADAVHSWGEKLYITAARPGYDTDDSTAMAINAALKPGSPVAGKFAFDPLIEPDQPLLRSLPVINTSSGANAGNMQVGLAADVYDKSNNSILNIKGGHISYQDYLALRKNMRKINVVFVVDGGSAMRNYFAGLTSTIQSFEKVFNSYNAGNQIQYGAVVYRSESNCTTGGIEQQPFNSDYRQVVRFLDKQAAVTAGCAAATNSQPLFEGIGASVNMLASRRNQTNLIVLIGSTGNGYYNNESIYNLASRVASADARILAIQVYSDYKPIYNDFVIQARKLVSESAVQAAERKKSRMVVGEGLTNSQQFNTSVSDSVSFYLDYPRNSLVQGAVVFPPKGVVKSNQAMEASLSRLMAETQYDIKSQTHSLDSAFRLTGREHRYVSPVVLTQLSAPVPDNLGDDMPHNAFKYFLTADLPASVVTEHPQLLQYSLILNDAEYKQMQDILSLMIGENLQQDAGNFRKKLFRNYLNILQDNLDMDISRGDIKKMRLTDYIQKATGLIPPANPALGTYRVIDLKRTGNMPQQPFEAYISYLIRSRNNMKQQTMLKQHFLSNGKVYYYVTQANWQQ
ncbi:VWA domain-containing protein [Mucilaginibacter sp. Bleaf8]|uniref:type VI secretion system protein TssR domain-containing protein n=1 Tax=Mucilaginibacter sp. Bleaf8 TaxID=2834430 RepID=UPI001BCDE3EB|nr:type VI secretion system protein TssR domain-containing protein [Mucilaginibacter sp. Bleaf8]MBS7566726.1 VWA domain-containing protein [Mucilaginibacter sp. Bleaf8]